MVNVDKFIFLADFLVLDMKENEDFLIILGLRLGKLTLRLGTSSTVHRSCNVQDLNNKNDSHVVF